MKTGISKIAERTAAAALAGVLAAGMLSGCGNGKLDGTKTVATVNGTDITLGLVSLYARQQQAYTESLYASMMGGADYAIWDTVADEDSGETYGEQVVSDSLEQIERMYLMKEKAGDYGVEVTADEESAIAEAAAAFMADNTEEAIADLGVTEEDVKTLLELRTYSEKIYDPIIADTDREVSDEEAQQSSFTYVSISALGENLTAEEIEGTKANAQEILDKMKEDPTADMDEIAKSVDDTLSAYSGHFAAYEGGDDDSSYPDEVIEALRGLEDGQVADEVIETDSSYYIVRLDEKYNEEETESHRESIISERETELYNDTLDQWLEDADVKVQDKVLKTLKVTDNHKFTLAAEETAEDETADEESADETVVEDEADETGDAAEDTGDAAADESTDGTDASDAADTSVGDDADQSEDAGAEEGNEDTSSEGTEDTGSDAAETDEEPETVSDEDAAAGAEK